jgi:hypothetical protein
MAGRIGEAPARLVGFLSYARADDDHDDGQLTALRRLLEGELEAQTGDAVEIFQDREDILWGQAWRTRVQEGIDASTILIPIVTPRFYKSRACRNELGRFLERESELGREDLIFPLYYITTSLIDDPEARRADELASVINDRNYKDWRERRFEDVRSLPIRREVQSLAAEILRAVDRRPAAAGAREELVDDDGWADDSPGLVEQLAAMEQASDDLPVTLDAMTDVLNRIRAVTEDATEDTLRANRAPNPARAKLNAAQRQRSRLAPLVAEHESLSADYKDLIGKVDLGTVALFDRIAADLGTDVEAARSFLKSKIASSESALRTIESTRGYVKTLEETRSLSSTLRPLHRRLVVSCLRMIDNEPVFVRWQARAQEILTALNDGSS